MRNSLICLICSFLFCYETFAKEVELCGNVEQGELLYGIAQGAKKIKFSGKEYDVNDEGEFLIALSRDENPNKVLEVIYNDNISKQYDVKVKKHNWNVQSIKGVAQNKVTPSANDESEILRERTDVKNALNKSGTDSQDWKKGFILPLDGRISGYFGNQRIFNNIPKSPHTGVDIAAPEGTKIKASGDGKVLLAGGNYFYSGNMVIIDHGQGLKTIYAHLSKVLVNEDQNVKKGDVIGLVGATGRATGPHLHWGVTLNDIRFRPHSLLENNKENCKVFIAKD